MDDVQVLVFDPIVLHGHMAAVSEQCLKIVESIDCLILFLVVLALAFCFLFMEVAGEVQDTTDQVEDISQKLKDVRALTRIELEMSALNYIWQTKPVIADEHVNEVGEVARAAAAWANEMHLSLSGIRENTSRYLFWTILLCMITTSILLLHTLNSLWYQLVDLNAHQSEYKQMWLEERAEMAQQLKRDEESRNIMFEKLARQASLAGQAKQVSSHGQAARRQQFAPQQSAIISDSTRHKLSEILQQPGVLDDLPDFDM
ncbi:hypothetical protein SUNI508_12974 [Seiridium unicorne]|uniref:Uncharacterized protein n=1 Tax=Seiridium unicorne TaxID=138068 RepID=A0ABR2VET8_9PEZI